MDKERTIKLLMDEYSYPYITALTTYYRFERNGGDLIAYVDRIRMKKRLAKEKREQIVQRRKEREDKLKVTRLYEKVNGKWIECNP